MKVLFAVNNEKISEAIIKKYQTMYKEIISWKNVYFFNAIIKELQKDKSYDRIVIGEDLEPYANNNYEVIDNFLFDKLDSISDEASNSREGDIPIILIATDRREKGEALLVKLFGIGIYNVLLGQDRKIDSVCKLIYQPRTKKEAKSYYRIESDDVEYQSVDPDSVSETEIQNIIRHYKKLGKDEARYVESFNDIAAQYTDTQLKLITKFLPLNVRAVLEEKCPKYQQVMIGSVKGQIAAQANSSKKFTTRDIQSKNVNKIDLIDRELQKAKLTKPVVIPSTINMQNVKRAYTNTKKEQIENVAMNNNSQPNINSNSYANINNANNNGFNDINSNTFNNNFNSGNNNPLDDFNNSLDFNNQMNDFNTVQNIPTSVPQITEEQNIETVKKGRGRPRKEKTPEELAAEEAKVKKGRGRPRKVVEQPIQNVDNSSEDIDLFGLATDNQGDNNQITDNNTMLPGLDDDFSLPGLDENENNVKPSNNVQNNTVQPSNQANNSINNNGQDTDFFGNDLTNNNYNNISNDDFFGNDLSINQLPGMENFNNNQINPTEKTQNNFGYNNKTYSDIQYNNQNTDNTYNNNQYNNINNKPIEKDTTVNSTNNNFIHLITGEKKIVAFVGTSKNGTSFLVNNLAANLSGKGINTAILDLTQNKNAYYIYTLNEDKLRDKAFKCIDGLRSGIADGIQVNKNLTVYTTLPGENPSFDDYSNILETLIKNHSLILLDCDFDTNLNYFANSQEIYLVQTYDILTIQPLTAFLNEMKYKNILDQNKLRIVINKTLKLRKLTDQMIIGGISCYNDPASTYINTLFDKDKVRYTTIPFEDQTYARYLERLVDCEISLNGYSKIFLDALDKLSNMVYPLIAGNTKYPQTKNYNDYSRKNTNTTFNSNMNATLNKMRNNF